MTVHRPGDVLAGRYRLADLLSESAHGRFWLAHDSILGRPVAVHVIDADDPRAPALMDAARASASIADPRLLRVLDAETREGISYVVNEWGRGTSLDILLARSGPLSPRRAAWVTSEVAAALARAHALGHAHGRLRPENVLIDETGGVRIIGFAVEAALYGLPAGTAADDDTQLAAVLTASLTGTWPGDTESSVPPTPTAGGHPLRPRQVRAGVPKVLDELCEAALNPESRGRHEGPVLDARYLHSQLVAFLGDPSDVAGLPAEHGAHTPRITTSLTLPPVPAGTAPDTGPDSSPDSATDTATDTAPTPAGTAPDPAGLPVGLRSTPPDPSADRNADTGADTGGQPTEAGLPSFEDDSSWHLPRTTPAPPPPTLEPPAPKPLFADEVGADRARTDEAAPDPARPASDRTVVDAPTLAGYTPDEPASPSAGATPAPTTHPEQGDYWPWGDDGTRERRSRWLPLAIGLVALVLVVAAVLIVRAVSSSDDGAGSGTPSGGASATPGAKPITRIVATDFDPYGNPPSENPASAKYAVDGKDNTRWQTVTYQDQLGTKPPALKSGVGLVLDLRRTYAVDSVHLRLGTSPTALSVYVTDTKPSDVTGLKAAGRARIAGDTGEVAVHGARGRYVVVWLTSLPSVSGGYRGEVDEVSVTGTAR